MDVQKWMARTDAEMSVDAGVTRRSGQVLVFPVRYVLVRARISILLGEAEVDDVNEVALLAEAHQEVVGFDVAMDKVFWVNVFHPADLLQAIFKKLNCWKEPRKWINKRRPAD